MDYNSNVNSTTSSEDNVNKMNSVYTINDGTTNSSTVLSTSTSPVNNTSSSSTNITDVNVSAPSGISFKDDSSSMMSTTNGTSVSKTSNTIDVKRARKNKNVMKKSVKKEELTSIDAPEKIIGSQVMVKNKLSAKMVQMLKEMGYPISSMSNKVENKHELTSA